jgi:hypothetical protein
MDTIIHSSNQLFAGASVEGTNLAPLTVQQVQPIEEEAIRLWEAAGANPASFKGVDVNIVDLPGSGLGFWQRQRRSSSPRRLGDVAHPQPTNF